MTVWVFSILLLLLGYLSGLVGALTGLGGGAILIPVLVLWLKIDIHYAMGASLICVIATSSGVALASGKKYVNMRIGLFLETAAVLAALAGAFLVPFIPAAKVALLFGIVLLFTSYLSFRRHQALMIPSASSHPWARVLKLEGEYLHHGAQKRYTVQNVPLGWGLMAGAGMLSGLLGIGAGSVKVLVMDQALQLPYKVATSTSNFMMGITAAASMGLYFSHGYIIPSLTFPIVLGVILGAWSGSQALTVIKSRLLRLFFSGVIALLACQLIYKGLTGNL